MELTVQQLEPWFIKLSSQSDATLAELSWPTFSAANPTVGLNAASKSGTEKNWMSTHLERIAKSAGEEGEKFVVAISLLAYRTGQAGLDLTKPASDFILSVLERWYHDVTRIPEIVRDAEKATDIHLFLIVAGFLAGFVFPQLEHNPVGDIAAFAIFSLRNVPRIFGK